MQMISGLLGTSEKKISPSFLPVYPIHKVKGSFAETKEGRKEDPPPNFWSPQNSKDFQVPSSPIGFVYFLVLSSCFVSDKHSLNFPNLHGGNSSSYRMVLLKCSHEAFVAGCSTHFSCVAHMRRLIAPLANVSLAAPPANVSCSELGVVCT